MTVCFYSTTMDGHLTVGVIMEGSGIISKAHESDRAVCSGTYKLMHIKSTSQDTVYQSYCALSRATKGSIY